MAKIIFEKNKCIGCGACTIVCPNYWEIGDNNTAVLKEGIVVGENIEREVEKIECNQSAADGCPVQCINIKEK